jgi:hypothetical protein
MTVGLSSASVFAEQSRSEIAVELEPRPRFGGSRAELDAAQSAATAPAASTANCQHGGYKKGTAQTSVRVGTSEPPRREYPCG